jgi:hypothetical protein
MIESFSEFKMEADRLDEALITFAGKAYPKFGQFLILAGGAGSGKGFIQDNLIGMQGKTIDVDKIKKLAMASNVFAARVKKETGYDLKTFDLRKPENVSKVHEILGDIYKTDKKLMTTFSRSVLSAHPDRKPNIIMDVTLKDMKKLRTLSEYAETLGYDKKDVHLIWVVNDIEVAIEQNATRSRVVPVEILLGTHVGAANTMKEVLNMGKSITRYLDGEIVLAFNKFKVDSTLIKNTIKHAEPMKKVGLGGGKEGGGQILTDVKYVYMKHAGKALTSIKDMEAEFYDKIKSYVPKGTVWESTEVLLDGVMIEGEEMWDIDDDMSDDWPNV